MQEDRAELLRKMPKIEMHIHLEGAIFPETAIELAHHNDVSLPPYTEPADLYSFQTLEEFLVVYSALAKSVVTAEDFRRITYEMLVSAAKSGARHQEFFISPHVHHGIPFSRQFEGIRAGMRDAKTDYGISSLIIPGVNRELGPAAAEEYLDEILANRGDDVVGIGLDFNELPYPPEPFAAVFARARKSGLKLSAHCGETGPAAYVRETIDTLNVDRVDHGYNIVDDLDLMRRAQDMDIMFTCCPTNTVYTSACHSLSSPENPIRRMKEAGLVISINSDDPPMINTDLNNEFVLAMDEMKFSSEDMRELTLASIEHAWVDESTKQQWRVEWKPEIDRIADLLR